MNTDEAQRLKRRQELGQRVQERMLHHLLNYGPIRELKVGDIHVIAEMARTHAFEAMQELQEQ